MKPYLNTYARAICCCLVLLVPGGCETVRPWERGVLAKETMQLEEDATLSQLKDQVFSSKEASSGGNRPAGGGCGCN